MFDDVTNKKKPLRTTYCTHQTKNSFKGSEMKLRHKKLRRAAQCWKRSIGVNQIKRRWKKRVGSQYVQRDLNNKSSSRGEIKVQIFWEGHKNWKKKSHFILTLRSMYIIQKKNSGRFFFQILCLLTISELYQSMKGLTIRVQNHHI